MCLPYMSVLYVVEASKQGRAHTMPDEPSLTQPLTYAEIAKHPTVLELHTQELIEQGLVDRAYVRSLSERILLEYEREFARAKEYQPAPEDWLASNWQGDAISSLCQTRPYNFTGVPIKTLEALGHAITRIPPTFTPHPQVEAYACCLGQLCLLVPLLNARC